MELSEVFPAVQAAEEAVRLDPTWSVARQTLGRAQLGLGEVHMVSSSNQCTWHAVSCTQLSDGTRHDVVKFVCRL